MTVEEARRHHLREQKGFRAKLLYILSVRRIPILCAICVLAVICSIVTMALTDKKNVLTVYCLNAVGPQETGELEAKVLDGLDPEKYTVSILRAAYDDSGDPAALAEMQSFQALLMAGEVDVVAADKETFAHLAENDCFLSPEGTCLPNDSCLFRQFRFDAKDVFIGICAKTGREERAQAFVTLCLE